MKPSRRLRVRRQPLWAEVFEGAGLPAGVVDVVVHKAGDGSKIGDESAENLGPSDHLHGSSATAAGLPRRPAGT